MNSLRQISVLLLFLTLTHFANAQRNRQNTPAKVGRNSNEMKEVLGSLSEATMRATCQISDGKRNLVLGTVISTDGWLVTKHSEIKGAKNLKCTFGDGLTFTPKVVSVDEGYDLALLKIEAKGLTSATSTEQADGIKVGQIVVSFDENGKALSMGLITATPRKFSLRERPVDPGRGFLGVSCRPSEEGLVVRTVNEQSGAQRAGLKAGDIITKLEDKKVVSTAAMIEILDEHKPEEIIQISLNRGGKILELEATLGALPNAQTDRSDKWGGGPFSDRRFNFPKVIPHDSVIRPEQCGGPLLNSDGEVIGVNIARAVRVATYAVPMQEIKEFVKQGQSSLKTN